MSELHLHKRPSGIYHLRGTIQRQRVDESTRTRCPAQAEEIKAKRTTELFRRAVRGERSVVCFAEAAADYMAAGGEEIHIPALIAELGETRVSDVTQRLVDDIASRRDTKPATLIRQIYTPVAAVLNHARPEATGKISFRKPKVRAARTGHMTPAQVEAWITALPSYLSGLVTFLAATGCRITEAITLDWKDVSPSGQRVVFWDTKSGHARGVDLQERGRLALPAQGVGPVFRTMRGLPWHGYDAVNLMLRRHGARDKGLLPAHCHLFRHTWATWAYAATRDLTFLMQQGGWRSLSMVGRYTHAGSADLALSALTYGWEFSGREILELPTKTIKP